MLEIIKWGIVGGLSVFLVYAGIMLGIALIGLIVYGLVLLVVRIIVFFS